MIKCNWITLIFFAVIVMLLMTFTYEKKVNGDTKGTMGTFDKWEPETDGKRAGATDCTPKPKSKRLWILWGFIGAVVVFMSGFYTGMFLINIHWQDKEDRRIKMDDEYYKGLERRIKEMGEGKQ